MPDFPQTVAIPSTGSYAAPLMNFGVIGNLPNDYAQGQKNQFDEQERQRQLRLRQPVGSTDPKQMAIELSQRDPGMAAQLLPFLLGQEPGQISPLSGVPGSQPQGGAPGGPQGGYGGPSAAPATTPQQSRPVAPTAPAPAYSGGDAGTGTVVDIVTGILPENSAKTGKLIGNFAKALKVDANAPLTPQQQAKATQMVQAYAQRNGIASAAPGQGSQGDGSPTFDQRWAAGSPDGARAVGPGARVLHPQPPQGRPPVPGGQQPPPQRQPAQGQDGASSAQIPGMILPPGFKPGQEAEAVQALLAEGAKFTASPNARTRAEGELLLNRAAEIEKKLQPRIVGGNLVDPRGEVIYSPTSGNARDIAEGIKAGEQPPTTTGLGRLAPQVRGLLAKDGFNLAKATQEWSAAQKQIQSLNGPQMTRYAGLANSVVNTIDEVKNLAEQMDNSGIAGGIPLLNRAKLATFIQAEGNSANGQLAARYLAGINTLKEEFANLAQGGYAPTESAWGLAEQQINGNYGVKELNASLDEVQRLIKYRIQGIPNFSTLGPAAPGNRYFGQGGNSGAAEPAKEGQASPSSPDPLAQARAAIAAGAPRDAVIKRMQEHGIDASGL
jgi:hypothetical protein